MNISTRLVVLVGMLLNLDIASGVAQVSSSTSGTQLSTNSSATTVGSVSSQTQSILVVYQQEQQALASAERALVDAGASDQQILNWKQANASRFAAQEQRAQAMALAAEAQLRPTTQNSQVPSTVSSSVGNYLSSQASLARAIALARNQLIQSSVSSSGTLTLDQADQIESSAIQTAMQEDASLLSLQSQRAATFAAATANQLLVVPTTPVIPSGTSPAMATFLTARNQLRQQLVALRRQYATADPATRDAAMLQWQQQNATLIAQFQTAAQNVTATSPQN